MNGNLQVLHDLGDGLAELYTAFNRRIGYDDASLLLGELLAELHRLDTAAANGMHWPQPVTGGDWEAHVVATHTARIAELDTIQHLARIGEQLGSLVYLYADHLDRPGSDWPDLVQRCLAEVLDLACACLTWSVTR